MYPPEGHWAEPSVEHAAALMRRVYLERGEAAAIAEQAKRDIASRLSAEATGLAMRHRLEELTGHVAGGRQPSPHDTQASAAMTHDRPVAGSVGDARAS